jgi:hypothetical protein
MAYVAHATDELAKLAIGMFDGVYFDLAGWKDDRRLKVENNEA